MVVKGDRRGHASKKQATESKETRIIQKAEEQSDIFNMCFQTYFQNLVASKKDSRSVWKATNTLTNKDASKPQVTVKELPK